MRMAGPALACKRHGSETLTQMRVGTCAGAAFEENKEEIEQGNEYEFTAWEGRILEVVMESMRMAGLALAVRAMATICLGAFPEELNMPCHLSVPLSLRAASPPAEVKSLNDLRIVQMDCVT